MEYFWLMQECATWRGNWNDVGYNTREEGNYQGYQTDRSVCIFIFAASPLIL
jgi:hypothetical protein